MRLISMVDFVLKQELKLDESYKEASNAIESIFRYANFLKQPLELGMFVPCDDDGDVLEEPKNFSSDFEDEFNSVDRDSYVFAWYNDCKTYHVAKERVLFEGFTVKRFINKDNPCYVVSNGENEVTFHIGLYTFSKGVDFAKAIEDLIHIKPNLTQSAIKKLNENNPY